jgi:hypothetical protein
MLSGNSPDCAVQREPGPSRVRPAPSMQAGVPGWRRPRRLRPRSGCCANGCDRSPARGRADWAQADHRFRRASRDRPRRSRRLPPDAADAAEQPDRETTDSRPAGYAPLRRRPAHGRGLSRVDGVRVEACAVCHAPRHERRKCLSRVEAVPGQERADMSATAGPSLVLEAEAMTADLSQVHLDRDTSWLARPATSACCYRQARSCRRSPRR